MVLRELPYEHNYLMLSLRMVQLLSHIKLFKQNIVFHPKSYPNYPSSLRMYIMYAVNSSCNLEGM